MTTHDIKKLLLASVAFTTLTAASAWAADIPPARPLPMPKAPVFVPFFTWNGFYLGINAGYGFGTSNWTDVGTGVTTGDFDATGALVGGTIGYNLQFGSVVFGVEADLAWSNLQGSTTANCIGGCETKNTWLGTARGRLGYAFDRFMPYFTGGAAFGDVKVNPGALGLSSVTETRVGWTLGGGIEYSFLPNWTVKFEYLYVDLGTMRCPAANCGTEVDVTLNTNILRGGVNYRF